MSDQGSLDGFEEPAAPTDRLFFAFMPDDKAAARAQAMAETLGAENDAKPRKAAREKFHITLFHVGDFMGLPAQTVAQACRVADGLRAEPFGISLDRLGSFSGSPRRLPYVLLSGEAPLLAAFQAEMQSRMLRQGLTQGLHHRHYTPHLTLLYGHRPLAERPIEPLSWTAREFVLIRSLIGKGHYEHLGRWPLRLTGPPTHELGSPREGGQGKD
jgi:2'-5' RNA ligase